MRSLFAVLALSTLFAAPALAHIELMEPTPRYTIAQSGDNKACPCGLGESNRLCNVPGDKSDPDRATDKVTVLEAGSTVRFLFEEYVGHSGRYRVAIDYDGADLEDFNQNILVDIPDPVGAAGNTGQGSIWEIEVPIPNMSCDNCTLQLVQMMDGNTTDPVPDPAGRSSYYTCADIQIVPAGTEVSDAGPDSGGGNDAGIAAGSDAGDTTVPISNSGGCQQGGSSGLAGLLLLGAALFLNRSRSVAVHAADVRP